MIQKIFHFLHIVGFVSWFAALIYLGRLFVYHKVILEKNDRTDYDKAQLDLLSNMENRLYRYIASPAMGITLIVGITSAYLGGFFSHPWIHAKMLLIFFLVGYHHHLGGLRKRLQKKEAKQSSRFFRWYNEVGTIFLILISSLAVFKQAELALLVSFVLIAAVFVVYRAIKFFICVSCSKKNG